VGRIDRPRHAPVAFFVDEPTAWAQACHHLVDRCLLPARQPEQHQPGADQVERSGAESIQRIVKDVVLHHLQIRQVEPGQVAAVDVGGHDLAARAYPLGQPGGHGPAASTDLQAPPARPHEVTPTARAGIEELFQEAQPFIFGFLAARRRQAVARFAAYRAT